MVYQKDSSFTKVLEKQGIKMVSDGRDRIKGPCPLPGHNDKDPSFKVWIHDNRFHCFGCNRSGSLVEYIMLQQGVDTESARLILHDEYGMELKGHSPFSNTRLIQEVNGFAAILFHAALLQHKPALDYARKTRGLKDDTIEEWMLGYAPADNQVIKRLREEGFSDKTMEDASLAKRQGARYASFFNDRLIFPLRAQHGKVSGFTGRALSEGSDAKYINIANTDAFDKKSYIFGLYESRPEITKHRRVVVGEGYTDAMTSHQSGIKNFVSMLSAHLSDEQIAVLARYADTIILATDADEAGERAVTDSFSRLKAKNLEVRIALLESPYKDPDEQIRKIGAESFKRSIEHSVSFFDYKLANCLARYDMHTFEGRQHLASKMVPVIAASTNYIERYERVLALSERCGFDLDAVKQSVSSYKANVPVMLNPETFKEEKALLAHLMKAYSNPQAKAKEGSVGYAIKPDTFSHPGLNRIFCDWRQMEQVVLTHEDKRLLAQVKRMDPNGTDVKAALRTLHAARRRREERVLLEQLQVADQGSDSSEVLNILRQLRKSQEDS